MTRTLTGTCEGNVLILDELLGMNAHARVTVTVDIDDDRIPLPAEMTWLPRTRAVPDMDDFDEVLWFGQKPPRQ
jgi:hypothetical protein